MRAGELLTHSELCEAVARKQSKAWITLYEYQSYATSEFPDVITFGGPNGTILFEIKTSHSDFLADAKKEARKKWAPKVGWALWRIDERHPDGRRAIAALKAESPDLYYIQAPHLGVQRYFVCEPEIIDPNEVPEGWGLYWFKSGKMFRKVESQWWRNNVHEEKNILVHAFRRWASGDHHNIIVNTYYIPNEKERAEIARDRNPETRL